ncbi:hypothetical protein EAI_06996 [Harpegnathos saltator]|uniref:Uncharacterized protein n=1 Tax=Harpegnathos saltator TaxID=610380 RepID=E2C4J2_HARSA|nr:hypothetical protein EAI_06996 [Harpegnathos saltator]
MKIGMGMMMMMMRLRILMRIEKAAKIKTNVDDDDDNGNDEAKDNKDNDKNNGQDENKDGGKTMKLTSMRIMIRSYPTGLIASRLPTPPRASPGTYLSSWKHQATLGKCATPQRILHENESENEEISQEESAVAAHLRRDSGA